MNFDPAEKSHETRHERDQSFLMPVPVPAKKKILISVPAEKVLGLGPGPFRNKFWLRSQSWPR